MDEDKVIRPMDFVRLTNIDESNVIKDTKNHIGLVKEVSRDGRMSIIWIGETYSQLAWFKSSELEVVDNLVSILTCGLANFRGDGKESWLRSPDWFVWRRCQDRLVWLRRQD